MSLTTSITPTQQIVSSLLSGLATGLGIGRRCVLGWDRSGASELNLLAGEPWTAQEIYGNIGRFTLEIPNAPVQDVSLGYVLRGEDLILDAHANLVGFVKHLTPGPVGSSQPVGAIGILSILSALPIIWSLLNPKVTLNLPGQMKLDLILADAKTLIVEFKTPPTVTVVWGIRWSNEPQRLMLTDKLCRVNYRLGIFNRTQEWEF